MSTDADTAAANIAAWRQYAAAAAAAEHADPGVVPDRLEWTQVPGLGPGEEILGPLGGRRVLELGCGTGRSAALLAARGARVTALDASQAQIHRARTRWAGQTNVEFICADAHSYLSAQHGVHDTRYDRYDLVLSIFGACDFTPPELLLPVITACLRPGGTFALSTVHPCQQPPERLPLGPDRLSTRLTRPLRPPRWWVASLLPERPPHRIPAARPRPWRAHALLRHPLCHREVRPAADRRRARR